MAAPTANLGYGKQSEATIDQANIAMRAMPWYHDQLLLWGQDPNNTHLSKSQSQELLKQAQGHGFIVDEGDMEMDSSGNFNPKGHKLRNTLIVAGLAGATIATLGAAGAFSGAALPGMAGGASGAGAAGAGGAGAAGLGVGSGIGVGGIGTGGLVGGTTAGIGGAAAVPAALGGALVPTIAPGLAGLSSGSLIGGGVAAGTSAATGATTGAGSLMSRLLKPGNLADLASTAGAFGQGQKANRIVEGNFAGQYDRNMLDAQTGRNQNEADALRKMAQTNYIAEGGTKFKPIGLNLNGRSYAPVDMGFGPEKTTPYEKSGANALQGQLIQRLGPNGSYTPQPFDSYAKPGTGEKISDYLGTGLGVGGTIANILGWGGK